MPNFVARMPGVYLHIPFCRKACHYCNFHFSTTHHLLPQMVDAMAREIETGLLPVPVNSLQPVNSVYLGGGTPSLLQQDQLQRLLAAVASRFPVNRDAEVTLEANPDDINEAALAAWRDAGINRLSIGIQSFYDEDLRWMNRAHSAAQALRAIGLAQQAGFSNITIDLIYGTPTLTDDRWRDNLSKAIDSGVPHISSYALTVEPRTALQHFIDKGKVPPIDDQAQSRQFDILMDALEAAGFEHYEISNFARPGHRSRHNSAYWSGEPYLGFGPSAHSFDGQLTRWWNMANNRLYLDAIDRGESVWEMESLTALQRLNEKIMTGLRTAEGIPFQAGEATVCGARIQPGPMSEFIKQVEAFEQRGWLQTGDGRIRLTRSGRHWADHISAALFLEG